MITIIMKKCLILLLILHQGLCASDPTTCMTDFEENDELHFVCFCHDNFEEAIEEQAKHIAEHQGFSLAHFAYNLAGSYFGKSVHIVFQSCRHLKLVLDHSELSRIGSDLFRPDIQLRELRIEQVYHLELLQSPPRKVDEFQDEYLIAFPSEALQIKLYAVALVKLDAGAKFSELKAISEDVRLYIDLNQGHLGDEDNLNIRGFMLNHIFFITRNQKIPLHEGENLQAKMKELSAINVNSRSTFELSFALVAFAIVIFLGILGLFIVVSHRQKKKRHLKALLRAKNLGPMLESKEIAHTTASKHYPQYLKTSVSRGQTPCPDIENPVVSDKKIRKLDVNELLAGIMIRMRRDKSFQPRQSPTQETSFFYKESSLSNNSDENNIKNISVQMHRIESESDSTTEEYNSHVSRISQQVFVKENNVKKYEKMSKMMTTFFSSVSKQRNNTKL